MPRAPQAPPAGIVRTATPEANGGRWWDCNNVRFRQGMAQPIGGNVAQPNSGTPDAIRDIITWHDDNYVRWAAYGTDQKLYAYRYDLQTRYDITPAGVGPLDPPGALVGYGLADYGESTFGTTRDPADIGPQDIAATMGDRWSMDTFGKLLLVVPTQDGKLFVWDPSTPTAVAVVVAEAPVNNKGVIVTDQRSVVLLGAGGDPRNIAWSDQEDIHMWVPDITNLAGAQQLQTQAYVMCAMRVGRRHADLDHQRPAQDEVCWPALRLWHCADRLGLRADVVAGAGVDRLVRRVARAADVLGLFRQRAATAFGCRRLVLLAAQSSDARPGVRFAEPDIQ